MPLSPTQGVASDRIGGRYRLLDLLGKGGVAEVFRAQDNVRGELVALKLLLPAAHERLRALFELEYQTLASLRHPRMVRVYNFGQDARGLYYTMELLDGADLSRDAPLAWPIVCDVLADAAEALGLLHARRLIHRDVSPRNLWRTPDGRVKLIDFGALMPFGVADHVIGTPPLVPPEALDHRPLDQRADLYALGAVAYFLLTGRHAFPARNIKALPAYWRAPLAAPSELLAEIGGTDLPTIPAALDALVLSLLQRADVARPSSAAEVIDRIDALRGTTREQDEQSAEAGLENLVFVGRARERRLLSRLLALADRGRGQACVIESEPGAGRSRVLKELALSARVSRAIVLEVDGAAARAPYGVASALALALLDGLPEPARAAAKEYASILVHASVQLAQRLGPEVAPAKFQARELRARLQEALCDWFLQLAREHTLVLLVDGLEHADDSSIAFLLSLARARRDVRLLITCALLRDPLAAANSVSLRALLQNARRLTLAPLSEPELQLLLSSVFGQAEHLGRLVGRLFRLTGGNPGYAIDLCHQLVRQGAIRFASGSWTLPRNLDEQNLSASRQEALLARLERLRAPARALARLLSVHAEPLSPGVCRTLAAVGGEDLLPQLGTLIAEQLLVPSGENLLFAHEALRDACLSELDPALQQQARRVLAQQLLAAGGTLERLQAGVHLLAAGDQAGAALISREAVHIIRDEVDKLTAAAGQFEQALALFRASGRDAYAQLPLLALMIIAGYHVDRRYLRDLAPSALDQMQDLLGLTTARRLRPRLGAKLSLAAGLGGAAWEFFRRRHDPCVPSFGGALSFLFASASILTGVSAEILDADAAEEHARVLEPFAVLGRDNLGGLIAEFLACLVASARDRTTEACERWQPLLQRLEDHRPIHKSTPSLLQGLHSGALLALGALEVHGDGDSTLRRADALENTNWRVNLLAAEQLRTLYYGSRGNVRAYVHHRERLEQLAIAHGTLWQLESGIAGPAGMIAFLLHDALTVKLECEQLERVAGNQPSLLRLVRELRAMYLMLHGRHEEALPLLAPCLQEPPLSRHGWTRAHGLLAQAHNRLGQHDQAHAACTRALEHLDPRDLAFPLLTLPTTSELAIAQAGLGQIELAEQHWSALVEQRTHRGNPLTLGVCYEAGIEISLVSGDLRTAQSRLAMLWSVYSDLHAATLTQHCATLAKRLDELARSVATRTSQNSPPANDTSALQHSIDLQLTADSATMLTQSLPRRS